MFKNIFSKTPKPDQIKSTTEPIPFDEIEYERTVVQIQTLEHVLERKVEVYSNQITNLQTEARELMSEKKVRQARLKLNYA